jgi:hypothetical protein
MALSVGNIIYASGTQRVAPLKAIEYINVQKQACLPLPNGSHFPYLQYGT